MFLSNTSLFFLLIIFIISVSLAFSYSLQVYDFPPSVSKDVPDPQPIREETYDVPPHFSKVKQTPPGQYLHNHDDDEPPIPEDVYDVPPPILTDKNYHSDRDVVSHPPQEIYDIPASLRSGSHTTQDVYDFPRDREEKGGERREHYIYDIPPQVQRLKSHCATYIFRFLSSFPQWRCNLFSLV